MLWLMMTLMLVSGSDDPAPASSRTEQLQQAREEKAEALQRPKRTFLETALLEFKERRVMERFQEGIYGFHPLVGGMHTGSGFAAGTYIEKNGLRASAQGSFNGYQKYELLFSAPRIGNDRFFGEVRATYRDYPQERFFGTGRNSRKEDQTNYRLGDTNYSGRLGFKPAKHIKAGVHGGWLETNVGRGTSSHLPSIERVFAAGETPGMENQPDYLQSGAFLDIDYRDEPANPRSGGRYMAQWTSFQDRKLGLFGFGQYDMEVQQYFPFLNQRRVFALRGKTTLTRTATGQQVPFFMQPALGGSEDLRGFREYRFRDGNAVVLNAEYRWEAFSGLDLALFADAGQVAPKLIDIDLADFQKSYGFGFRFNTAKNVFLRMDVGFSKEGRQVFLKFNHAF